MTDNARESTSGPLAGTVALVTGASSGIGEATARALAGLGAAVAVVARRADRLEELAQDLRTRGATALVVAGDLTDPDQAAAAVDRTVTELGGLDVVVNNAGLMLLGPSDSTPVQDWDRMLAVNVTATLHVTHAALPHLLHAADTGPRRVADLVNISSTAGRVARPGGAVYALTKFGVGAFTESLRKEHTRAHLRVAVVEPGGTATELTSHLRPEIRESLTAGDATEPMQPADVADAISYIVTRPRHVAVNELLIRPTEQEG